MKIKLLIALCSVFFTSIAQQKLTIDQTTTIDASNFWGIDTFGAIYYSNNNILYKKWDTQHLQFGDFTLGELSEVEILNPLKIILFYKHANTLVIIDKYFNEIDRINFNALPDFKNVSAISPANDDRLWIFDTNTQRLELFDTNLRKTIATSQPISQLPLQIQSNFNFCWLLTPTEILEFNIYGSLTNRSTHNGVLDFRITSNQLLVKKKNTLHYQTSKDHTSQLILPEIHIKQFHVTGEMLYIYDLTNIYRIPLNPKQK